jgi:hypothetical protein
MKCLLVLSNPPYGTEGSYNAKLARDPAKRGVDLIKQLLAFMRNDCIESPTLDPAKVVRKVEPLLRRAPEPHRARNAYRA